jgi:hypothetical protein
VHFEVESGHYSKQGFDDLQLHLVISFGHAVADAFYNRVDKFSREAPIHVGLGSSAVIRVHTVILAVSIKEFVADQFLDYVQNVLHQLCDLCVKSQLQDIEVLVGIIRTIFLEFYLLYGCC